MSPGPSSHPHSLVTDDPGITWQRLVAGEAGLLVDARDYYYAFFKAAQRARHYIVMAGWQFDSGVKLVRGPDVASSGARAGKHDVRLLKFLDGLCQKRPDLHIYMLAWDFHMVFALEREWMQKLWFDWTTNERLHFHFDDSHVPGGCHHQKFVVIDGRLAFLGGIDLCESRWDDRRHLANNRDRVSRGRKQKPYHDVQTYFSGPQVAEALTDLFRWRWQRSGADASLLHLEPRAGHIGHYAPRGALAFPPATPVALSRTEPRLDGGGAAREIRELYSRAIARVERLLYIETQYFSSRSVCRALSARMRDRSLPRLQIVLILNPRAEAVKEEIAVGLRQAEIIAHLRQLAAQTGHALGVYYTVAEHRPGGSLEAERKVKGTYIHSKLMVADDRFMTVGSANLTNRSMGIDSELNATWEVPSRGGGALVKAIRQSRVSLMAEHLGVKEPATLARLGRITGLVSFIDRLVERGEVRLRSHPSPTPGEARVLEVIDPQALPFDPETADGEDQPEPSEEQRSLFKLGLHALWDRFTSDDTPPSPPPRDGPHSAPVRG
jgi:phospholipase D1/2